MAKLVEATDKEIVFSVQEAPEGGFVARALGASIFTEADRFEELQEKFAKPLAASSRKVRDPE